MGLFNIFNKRKRELPIFKILLESENRDKYFYRLSPWDWLDNEMIHVFDKNSPRVVTMDPWPQLIYLAAKGQKTVSEFVVEMALSYNSKTPIPEELDETIITILNDLVEDNLIAFSDHKESLAPEIEFPKSQQQST